MVGCYCAACIANGLTYREVSSVMSRRVTFDSRSVRTEATSDEGYSIPRSIPVHSVGMRQG